MELRAEHDANGGIRQSNPWEDWFQLRATCIGSKGCAAEGTVANNELAELQAAFSAAQTPGSVGDARTRARKSRFTNLV